MPCTTARFGVSRGAMAGHVGVPGLESGVPRRGKAKGRGTTGAAGPGARDEVAHPFPRGHGGAGCGFSCLGRKPARCLPLHSDHHQTLLQVLHDWTATALPAPVEGMPGMAFSSFLFLTFLVAKVTGKLLARLLNEKSSG